MALVNWLTMSRHVLVPAILIALCGCSRPSPTKSNAVPAPTGDDAVALPPGMTAASVASTLPSEGRRDYRISAARGVLLFAHVSSDDKDVTLEVLRDGNSLPATMPRPVLWKGFTPAAGDYVVRVKGPAGAAYEVDLRRPRRILFDANSRSAQMSGTVLPGLRVDYVVRAPAERTFEVELRSHSATPHISVMSLEDGRRLLNHESETDVFVGRVDKSQDVAIGVVGDEASTAEYTLVVTIP